MTMSKSYNTIKVKKYADVMEEYDAVAAITPGHLIELTSADKVQKHSAAKATVLPMFAIEDTSQGNGIDDDYAADDKVQCWIPGRGDMAYAILADGEDVSIGDELGSNGDGTLRKVVEKTESSADTTIDYSHRVVGVAVEAKNLSASSGQESSGLTGDQRILIRVI